MAEVITTLHPENDETIDLYPNIKKENIPAGAIETSKIANEAVTEEKLNPALQARLSDEVVIVELSGTSGVISESSYNKLVNAEIGIIKIDNEFYYKAYIKEMGSPSYPVYHFVTLNQYAMNESNNDYLIRKDIAVNSSTRFWVKSTFLKSLSFYNEATETILIDHIDTGDLHSDGNINTDAGINAETESNIAGVVMSDGDIYANEIYLGDGEVPVNATLENLEECDNDNFYHLGDYDSVAQTYPNYVVINRHSGYIDLSKLNWTWNSSNSTYTSGDLQNIALRPASDGSSAVITWICTTATSTYADDVYLGNNGVALGVSGILYFKNENTSSTVKPTGILQFKYNSTYQYQEKVFKKRSLITLDNDGSQWLRNEWLKSLNMFDINDFHEAGGWDGQTGQPTSPGGDYVRYPRYIPVKSNDNYYQTNAIGNVLRIHFYTSDFIWISSTVNNNFTIPSNAAYMRYSGSYATMQNNYMVVHANHPYPYQKYYGIILHQVDVKPVTLWNNPSPNADFGGQITVSDMSIYKYIVIEYKDDPASDTASKYLKVKYEALKALYIEHPDGMRLVDFINSTTIDFDTTASYIIPVAIYGTNIL